MSESIEVPEINLGVFMIERMRRFGSSIALVEAKTGRTYSYANVIDRIEILAAGLRELGMGPGDVLCMMTYNHIHIPIFTLAVSMIGGVYQPLSPVNKNDDLQKQFQQCNTKFLVTTPDQAQRIHHMIQLTVSKLIAVKLFLYARMQSGLTPQSTVFQPCRDGATASYGKLKSFSFSKPNLLRYIIVLGKSEKFISYESLLGTSRVTEAIELNPRTGAAILLTSSGTTGLPKSVQLSHYNLVANLLQATHTSGWRCTIGFLANYHHYGMFGMQLCNLCYGLKIVIMEKYNTDEYLRLIEWHRADYLQLVPPVAIDLIKSGRPANFNISSVKCIYSAAAPLGKEVEAQLAALYHLNSISQTFGLTETGIATISTKSASRLGSVGKAAAGTQVKIVDVETRQDLPANEVGEILCRGPQMTMGYFNNPSANKDLYTADNFLKTGDVGYTDEDGFLFVSDRIKELIKYNGFQVAPAYLEDLLMKHPDIADAAVVGVADDIAGELPKAFVVKLHGSRVAEEDVIQYVQDKVSPHMRLRGGVEFIDRIPKSSSGKILRSVLKDRRPESKL